MTQSSQCIIDSLVKPVERPGNRITVTNGKHRSGYKYFYGSRKLVFIGKKCRLISVNTIQR